MSRKDRNKTGKRGKAAFLAFLAVCLLSASCIKSVIDSAPQSENFLVFATDDRREFESHEKSDADMIMVVSLNRQKKTVKVVNLLRNIGVEDESSGALKTIRLKNAYRQGGPGRLQEQVCRSFGLETGSYVRISMQTVIAAIDGIGGIDVSLTEEEADYMNNFNPELTYKKPKNIPNPERYFVSSPVHEGPNHMDGVTTVVYGRCRNVGGETARLGRFKTVLAESVKKASSMEAGKAAQLVRTIADAVETDLAPEKILSLSALAPDIGNYKISFLSVPENGEYSLEENDGNFVCVVDIENERERINHFLSGN